MNLLLAPVRTGFLVAAAAVSSITSLVAQDVAWAYVDPVGEGAMFIPSMDYQYTASGSPITVERFPGQQNRFRVVLTDMAPNTGIVQACAYDGNHTAVVNNWTTVGNDVVAYVELFDPAGGPANNGRFTLYYRRGGEDTQRQAYVWANNAVSPSYTPSTTYSWNGNRADPTITRINVGAYEVTLPGLAAAPGAEQGHVQATSYASSLLRTTVIGWDHVGGDVVAQVRCRDAAGIAVDGRFVLTYSESAGEISELDGSGAHVYAHDAIAPIYEPDGRWTDSNGTYSRNDSQVIERLGVGVYNVTLKSLVPDNLSIATVTAIGNTDRYATIDRWGDDGCNGTTVRVNTFDPDGNLADERFVLRYLTNRPAVSQAVAWAHVSPLGQGATFTPGMNYQFTTSGDAITVDRVPGSSSRFVVNLPGMAPKNGAVHACAYNGNHTAVVRRWNTVGDSVRVTVDLYDSNGDPANDAAFIVRFRRGGNNQNRESYLWASDPANPSYTPDGTYSWNADRGDPTIVRAGTGDYIVTLPGLAAAGPEFGHVQVTPYGDELRRVSIVGWDNNGDDAYAEVLLFDADGNPADGHFVLSYNEKAAPVGDTVGSGGHVWADAPLAASYSPSSDYTDSNGTVGPANQELVERISTGVYRVVLPDLAPSVSATVQVTPYGGGTEYASVDYWNGQGLASGTQVYVNTFDSSGNPADAKFTLLYLTNRPATGQTPATTMSFGSGCNGAVLEPLNRPVSCTVWDLDLSGLPGGAVFGFVQLDVTNPDRPLGMNAPGCTQYTDGAATVLAFLPLPSPVFSLEIPASPSFIGLSIYAQGGALVPGINAYGLAASNGVVGTIGNL